MTARLAMTALKELIITATVRLQVGRQRALDCTGHCDSYKRCRRRWRNKLSSFKRSKNVKSKKGLKKEDEDGGCRVQVWVRNDGR